MPVTDEQVEAAAKALAAAFSAAANKGDEDYEDFTPRQIATIALEAADKAPTWYESKEGES